MSVITIPKGDFVLVPRKDYEDLLELRKSIPSAKPTKSELKAIREGRREFKNGRYVSWYEARKELAHIRSGSR